MYNVDVAFTPNAFLYITTAGRWRSTMTDATRYETVRRNFGTTILTCWNATWKEMAHQQKRTLKNIRPSNAKNVFVQRKVMSESLENEREEREERERET